MQEYSIMVTRADGRQHPVAVKDPSFAAVCRQVFRFAQNAAIHGCPLGDALPPRCVEIHAGDGSLILRIMVDESLRPVVI